MSSSSADDSGAEEETIRGDGDMPDVLEPAINYHTSIDITPAAGAGRIAELLREERDSVSTPIQLGDGTNRYRTVQETKDDSENSSAEVALPRRAGSPIESVVSTQDDTPSIQVASHHFMAADALRIF